MKRYLNILHISVLIIFFGLILLPALNSYLHFINEEKGNENRQKHSKPGFDFSRLDDFVSDYDKYYTDNFSLRENAIKIHNRFEYNTLGVSPLPDEVILGKNRWFFEKDNLANYTGSNHFSEKEMAELKDELIDRTKWAKEKGINYYLVVVPSKMNVYPEYLPAWIVKQAESTRYDQIISLDNSPQLNVIGLKENLVKHKNVGYDLYQKTDGHWNDLGAYYGYQTIMNRLSKDYPELNPFPISDYNINVDQRSGGRIVSMINLEDRYPENYVALSEKNKVYAVNGKKRPYPVPETIPAEDHQIIKINDHGKNLKVLIIRDSFTLLLVRYLQEHFKESVFIHDEWKYRMREDLIEKEKPDIVLNIMYENGIGKLIEYPFLAKKNP